MQKKEKKKDWTLTPEAFRKFLAWLDDGMDSGGQNYLEMRRRLVAYFDRKNCLNPDEMADETLNRAARRLAEEGKIESETPAKFCYITARFVFMESLRTAAQTRSVPLDDALRTEKSAEFSPGSSAAARSENELKEKMLVCLEECTEKLEPENRELIIRYYFGEEREKIENRLALAEKLGISKNALSIRACRIRDKLEDCVGKCAEKQ